jgi:hypothetical protein
MARPADTRRKPLSARAVTHAIVDRRGGGGGRLERIFRPLAGAEVTGELIDSLLIIGHRPREQSSQPRRHEAMIGHSSEESIRAP